MESYASLDQAVRRSKLAGHHVVVAPEQIAIAPKPRERSIEDIVGDRMAPLMARVKFLESLMFAADGTPPSVEQVEARTSYPRMLAIIAATAAEFDIPVSDIISDRREKMIVIPRHVAMYLGCRKTLMSLPAIGRAVGDRDHTTVLYARDKIAVVRKVDAELDRKIVAIERVLNA